MIKNPTALKTNKENTDTPPGFSQRYQIENSSLTASPAKSKTFEYKLQKQDTVTGATSMLALMTGDPKIQLSMYPYLPGVMRSKEYFLWILSNPVSRYQLLVLLEYQCGILPELLEQQILSNVMGSVQASKGYLRSHEVFRKIEALGLNLNNLITPIMHDNDMSTSFLDAEVQQILVEASAEPRLLMRHAKNRRIGPHLIKLQNVISAHITLNKDGKNSSREDYYVDSRI